MYFCNYKLLAENAMSIELGKYTLSPVDGTRAAKIFPVWMQ